jgi:hypothetical protein
MTSWTDGRLKNTKVTYTDDDINVVGATTFTDKDSAYNTFFANSLDEGIQRWRNNPNNRFIMYKTDAGENKFVRVESNY